MECFTFSFGMLCLVTTCGLARDALNLLRERKGGYDIVISDVYMPDMDGFKLLEHVGLEMDLPVISRFLSFTLKEFHFKASLLNFMYTCTQALHALCI